MDSSKGMSIKDFLQGNHLKRGDIVLCSGKTGRFSKLIRWGTKSYFSHAALVFVVPHNEEGFDKAFVIESIGDGIDLTDLNHYLESDDYDIAVRRLETDWFVERDKEISKKIRGYMLDFIKDNYDSIMIMRIGLSLAYSMLFQRKQAPFEELLLKLLKSKKILPSGFICSGFVQHGYYKTIEKEVAKGKLDKKCLQDVIFHPNDNNSSKPRRLATSPREIAATNKLEWKFASKRENGVTTIYPIDSRTELEELFGKL